MWAAIAYAAVSAISSISQGMQQNKLYKAQAQGYEQQADAITRSSQYDAARKAEANKRLLATQEAEMLQGGAELNGSPLDFLVDQTRQMELDRQMILYNGTVQANAYRHQAALSRYQGKSAMSNGFMGAATSVLGTAAMGYANGWFSGAGSGAGAGVGATSSMGGSTMFSPFAGGLDPSYALNPSSYSPVPVTSSPL